MAAIPPSGRQYPIGHGGQRAVITEVGAGLRTYTIDGEALIDGYAEDEMCTVARGAPLLPWPNRLQDGRYEFGGVPVGLVIGLLVAAAVAARYLRKAFNAFMSSP